jgi:hypothetical protein
MNKYSPAPWSFEYSEFGGYDSLSSAYIVCDATGEEVTTIDNDSYGESERGQTNARLIASSPELLEALKIVSARLETILKFHGGTPIQIASHPDLIIARDIIAKTEVGLLLEIRRDKMDEKRFKTAMFLMELPFYLIGVGTLIVFAVIAPLPTLLVVGIMAILITPVIIGTNMLYGGKK